MENDSPAIEGTTRIIAGQRRVFYRCYWIKAYDEPADTLLAKKLLIEALTRRLFNHVEHGINIPGTRLGEARRAFAGENDPQKRRVKGAMVAGALFNRAAAVFTKVVELQALGIEIRADNGLMRECGEYLQEALSLGQMVLHRSGDEGIDELWGEPFKAFAFPIADFYKSRYIKIAEAMHGIDCIRDELTGTFGALPMYAGIAPLIRDFAQAAKVKCETLHTDDDIFDVWANFVTAAERLCAFAPALGDHPSPEARLCAAQGVQLIGVGKNLVSHITRARVPMPKSTRDLIGRVIHYRETYTAPAARLPPEAAYVSNPS